MIGYITTPEVAAAVLNGVRDAMTARGKPHFWSPGAYPIHTGPHAGKMFVPASDAVMQTPLTGRPVQRPIDYPEFGSLIATLGGLDARVEIDAADIATPEP